MDPSGRPACAIIKHANPCGAAIADTLDEAYQLAFECDERSAFGGIVALNRPVDDATVERMVAAAQADVVIAPGYAPGVVDRLVAKRKNTRILEAPSAHARRAPPPARHRRSAGAAAASLRGPPIDVDSRHRRGNRRRPSSTTPSWRSASAGT